MPPPDADRPGPGRSGTEQGGAATAGITDKLAAPIVPVKRFCDYRWRRPEINPENVSCQACATIPGLRLRLKWARRPNRSP